MNGKRMIVETIRFLRAKGVDEVDISKALRASYKIQLAKIKAHETTPGTTSLHHCLDAVFALPDYQK